jgi:uncharacterized protein
LQNPFNPLPESVVSGSLRVINQHPMTQPTYLPETWYDPRLTLGPSPTHGTGMFATADFAEGEVIMIWGGQLYTRAQLEAGQVPDCSYSFIDEDILMAAPQEGMDYFVNHSCDPNVWMVEPVTVVARRPIAAGEEIVGDYAVWEGSADYVLTPCTCGSPLCRGTVTGNDWQRPELQVRYAGHFLPYLNRRIARHSGTLP